MVRYSGRAKDYVCQRLTQDWRRLSDILELRQDAVEALPPGREPHSIWDWLAQRGKLGQLPMLLDDIERPELASYLRAETATGPAVDGNSGRPAEWVDHHLLDPAFFDLDPLRRVVEDALAPGPTGPMAFAVTYHDDVFISRVCDWLDYYADSLQRKPAIALDPVHGGVPAAIGQLGRYRIELVSTDVVCPVNVNRLADVEQFWTAVRGEFALAGRRLLLILKTDPEAHLPDGVCVLPSPAFTEREISMWAREFLRRLGLRAALVEQLVKAITTYATFGAGLNVRSVYEALDGAIEDGRCHRHWLKEQLEQGSYSAHSASGQHGVPPRPRW